VSYTTKTVRELAERLQSALETDAASSLGELLDAEVTWGDCAGRADVQHFVEAMISSGASINDATVEVLEGRLLVSFRLGGGGDGERLHQAVFVTGGRIVEICDGADREHALALRPVGPLTVAAGRVSSVTALAPILPVRDLAAAADHYRSLGFAVSLYDGDAAYGYAARDGLSVHLAEVADLDPADNPCAVYLYVSDADALYAQWRLTRPAGRLVAPVDTDYGLREGAHIDPNGNLLRFGSPPG
jgi:hypothetical protein